MTIELNAATNTVKVETIETASGGPVALTGQETIKGALHLDILAGNITKHSFNVSSVTDNGTANSTVNWTNYFGADSYVFTGMAGRNGVSTGSEYLTSTNYSTSSIRFEIRNDNGAATERNYAGILASGDLA